jgi:hypothetical protein
MSYVLKSIYVDLYFYKCHEFLGLKPAINLTVFLLYSSRIVNTV